MHLRDPVAQAIENQPPDHRVIGRQGVAAAAVVGVVEWIGFEQVVGFVVDALKAQGWAFVVALGGVVKHHVENDLNARPMQSLNHVAKLVHRPQGVFAGAVGPVGSEKAQGAVAPVVL